MSDFDRYKVMKAKRMVSMRDRNCGGLITEPAKITSLILEVNSLFTLNLSISDNTTVANKDFVLDKGLKSGQLKLMEDYSLPGDYL